MMQIPIREASFPREAIRESKAEPNQKLYVCESKFQFVPIDCTRVSKLSYLSTISNFISIGYRSHLEE